MNKAQMQALDFGGRLRLSHEDLMDQLIMIVDGWQGIAEGKVRGRTLTPWEKERMLFAKEAIAVAKELV
jgi:hypothetical protein